MKIYQHKSTQKLPISLETAWNFFSNPQNLSNITPEWLNFEVKTNLPDKMYAGMIVTYNVRPLLNIPQVWVTEITHVNELFYFVDEQRFGPYKFWHHQHIFSPTEDGKVLMQDIVSYVIPFGLLGRIINCFIVSKKIKEIFNYRKTILEKMFL